MTKERPKPWFAIVVAAGVVATMVMGFFALRN